VLARCWIVARAILALLALSLPVLSLFAAIAVAPLAQAQNAQAQNAGDDSALVARGEYLARAADCMPCHTGDKAKHYAGALPLNTPFGTLYSVNITSDPATGIGKWNYEQFRKALHDGIRADGSYLYPAMPFDAYTGIKDDDLRALWAYVRRIPPVKAPNPDNQLSFPFNIRLGLLAWRELFFALAEFKPTAGKSDEWNRGAYLVDALGHCTDCHSPRNILGAVKGKAQFTGSEIDGFYAPDITSKALAKSWTQDSLVQFFKTGSVPKKTSVFGPMADVVHGGLAGLTDPDLAAMATYLLDSPPPPDAPAPQRLSLLPAETYQRAAKLYLDNCAGCHQDHGTGTPGSIPPLTANPAVTAAEPYNVIAAVLQGLPANGSYGAMPSFAGRLSDAHIADLANYVRTSWGNHGAANASAKMVAAWRATVKVPSYGTEAAAAFSCPWVGGAPGAAGPDASMIAGLTAMLKGGNRNVPELVRLYQSASPNADPADVVNGLVTAYCPVVAASNRPDAQKHAELSRFSLQAAADVSQQTAAVSFPPVDLIWATPAGRTLVAREPSPFSGNLSCPAADNKLIATDLVEKARSLIGTPNLPMQGGRAAELAAEFATQNPKAAPADAANALIAAYCGVATVATSAGGAPQHSAAERFGWVEGFGQQVIEALQLHSMTGKG
jgi:mono/diheme cytochrome c family protein